VPMERVIQGEGNLEKYKNSVFYSDRSLGSFLDNARETAWWKNTLIIMVADHCCRVTADIPIYSLEAFKIPMVWTGGAISGGGRRIGKHGSQADIPVTLAGQLGLKQAFPFGKDLLAEESESFAFYTYNEGFGFVTDSSALAYDHKLKKPVLMEGKDPEYAGKCGKAFLQVLFNDYLKR
jgi:phosphoglycerol transferase MdoB-like AlkP superfamily enzyme